MYSFGQGLLMQQISLIGFRSFGIRAGRSDQPHLQTSLEEISGTCNAVYQAL
jgi:hypothetical protein